jgi:hypothetical protein
MLIVVTYSTVLAARFPIRLISPTGLRDSRNGAGAPGSNDDGSIATGAWRSLTCFWRANLSVVLGVATAVAVPCGALLRAIPCAVRCGDLVLQRLGCTDVALSATTFFREAPADDLGRMPPSTSFDVVPLYRQRGRCDGGRQRPARIGCRNLRSRRKVLAFPRRRAARP